MKLALVELLNPNPLFVYRSYLFPWFHAYFGPPRGECAHYFLQANDWGDGPQGNRFVYALPQEDMATLEAALRAFEPTHVLLNERLVEAQFQRLRACLPGAEFRMTAETRVDARACALWLGLDSEALRPSRVVASVPVPDYGGVPLNSRASAVRPFLPIWVGSDCSYCKPLANNPMFQEVDLSSFQAPWRCSFCDNQFSLIERFQQAPVPAALAQVRSAINTAPAEIYDLNFMVHGTNLLPQLDRFIEGLLELRTELDSGPGVGDGPLEGARLGRLQQISFWFSSRIDEFLACHQAVEQGLQKATGSGIHIRIWNMGVENFSETENLRFNKGLRLEQVSEASRILLGFAERYADTFHFAGFGYILFTPWTRVKDLRLNVVRFRALNLPSARHFVQATLELLADRPITLLAIRDGLIDTQAQPFASNGCVTSHWQSGLRWRFQDPCVAWIHEQMQSVLAGQVPVDDELALCCLERLVEQVQQAQASTEGFEQAKEGPRFEQWFQSRTQHSAGVQAVVAQAGPDDGTHAKWAALVLALKNELPQQAVAVARAEVPGSVAKVQFRDIRLQQPPARFGLCLKLDIDHVTLDVVLEPWEMGAKSLLGHAPVAIYHLPNPQPLSPLARALLQSLWQRAARLLNK